MDMLEIGFWVRLPLARRLNEEKVTRLLLRYSALTLCWKDGVREGLPSVWFSTLDGSGVGWSCEMDG